MHYKDKSHLFKIQPHAQVGTETEENHFSGFSFPSLKVKAKARLMCDSLPIVTGSWH